MLIPHSAIPDKTLNEVLEDFCTREGVDMTHASTLEQRKAQLMAQLESEQAFITYNADYEQVCLVPVSEVPAGALQAFKEVKASLAEEAKEAQELQTLKRSFAGPFPAGKTVMTSAVNALIEQRRLTVEDLGNCINRHRSGDFGEVPVCDQIANLRAIPHRDRVVSRYIVRGCNLRVITDAGFVRTTVLLASEY